VAEAVNSCDSSLASNQCFAAKECKAASPTAPLLSIKFAPHGNGGRDGKASCPPVRFDPGSTSGSRSSNSNTFGSQCGKYTSQLWPMFILN
jgi:hypothetical protein